MAGMVAGNVISGLMPVRHWNAPRDPESVFLDVRSLKEYRDGHVKGSIHIPVDELRGRLKEVPLDREVLVYCERGLRSYIAVRLLVQHGINAFNLSGGYVMHEAFQGIEDEKGK